MIWIYLEKTFGVKMLILEIFWKFGYFGKKNLENWIGIRIKTYNASGYIIIFFWGKKCWYWEYFGDFKNVIGNILEVWIGVGRGEDGVVKGGGGGFEG